jgi:hypothetical protein
MVLPINSEFATYKLTDEGVKNIEEIKGLFSDLLYNLNPLMGLSGREQSIVRTKLEESCFFAVKAASKLVENQR